MKIIKFVFRRNSIYIILFFIFYYTRRILKIILNKILKFNNNLIFSCLMHLGEFFGGLFSFLYQNKFIKRNREPIKLFGIKLLSKSNTMKRADGKPKIILLIFFAAFFDFTEFILISFFIPFLATMSPTVDIRLNSITTISSSLIFIYALRLKIGKHQFYSLIIIGICLLLVVIVESIYKTNELESFGILFLDYILTMLALSLITFTDTIEKYLYEFNFINPLLILLFESIFGICFIFSTILLFCYYNNNNLLKEIIQVYTELDISYFILLIILLFLFLVLSSFLNIYKVLSNIFYSPMAKSVSVYVLNPFMIIYSYINENDFTSKNEQNVFYFIINIILSIIIVFFGCIYNEFIILQCWGLEYETHHEIAIRADSQDYTIHELDLLQEDCNSDNEDDDNVNDDKILN